MVKFKLEKKSNFNRIEQVLFVRLLFYNIFFTLKLQKFSFNKTVSKFDDINTLYNII